MSDVPEVIAIRAIDYLLTDDFSHDVECELAFHPETFTPREKQMAELLGRIYRIAHGADTSASCHHVHTDWRKEADDVFRAALEEEGKSSK